MSEHDEQKYLFEWAELSRLPQLRWMFAVPIIRRDSCQQ
jgi:hypothetical protein